MRELDLNNTITAISTPIGRSGIGIVRITGKKALAVAARIFVSASGKGLGRLASHRVHYGWIVEDGRHIDEVLLTVMRAPKTYTRQDIVEINCHSGIAVLKRILELVLKQGVRLALPGEFTRRAYLNGRIDLAQAEAVLDIINSRTQGALTLASGQLQGRLSQCINKLRRGLLEILAELEASIDFSDQEIEALPQNGLFTKMQGVYQDIKELLASADKGAILREGVSCVICGRPNVGKSSLLNALLKKDRAIVTALAGTTRDSLEETVDLRGIPLCLIDTAGIIQTRNPAEKEAVRRSRNRLKQARIVLFVLDAGRRLSAQDRAIAREIGSKPAFVILNKTDLPVRITAEEAESLLPGRRVLGISALRGTGIDRLEKELADYIWEGKSPSAEEVLVNNIRHKELLKKGQTCLKRALKALKIGQGPELVVLDVKQAHRALAEIVGEITGTDILEQIFSRFCIGK